MVHVQKSICGVSWLLAYFERVNIFIIIRNGKKHSTEFIIIIQVSTHNLGWVYSKDNHALHDDLWIYTFIVGSLFSIVNRVVDRMRTSYYNNITNEKFVS